MEKKLEKNHRAANDARDGRIGGLVCRVDEGEDVHELQHRHRARCTLLLDGSAP